MIDLKTEIMRVDYADIRDNDHGGAVIEIALRSTSTGQSFMCPVDAGLAYKILQLFQIEFLRQASGKAILVLREEAYGYIIGLRSLPCDPEIEVLS